MDAGATQVGIFSEQVWVLSGERHHRCASTGPRGALPRRCGRVSTRVHSRYRRHLADLPVSGWPAGVWLTVRRFFCDHVDCGACTFVEQVVGAD